MSKFHLLALLMGVLLVTVPFTRNSALASDDDDDDSDDGDVVVLTEKNFDDIVKKSKFALVGVKILDLSPCPRDHLVLVCRSSFTPPGAGIAR